jgi:S-adenosylmethionine:tRNA ribosyltransferase-isomerase
MRTELFDFHLPEGRIAHAPATPRDMAKLLHVGDALHDKIVRDLPTLLNPGDVMVFNDSRVIPARLFADVNGRQIEVLLHQPLSSSPLEGERRLHLQTRGGNSAALLPPTDALKERIDSPSGGELWSAFARPAKKLKKGMVLLFAPDFSATVMGRSDDGQVLLEFPYPASELFAKLHAHGHMPLPPYIERADTAADQTNYQTIYARADGSVAAPTAGLHFTPSLMAALDARGVKRAYVTLHVGAGTFQPVKVEDTDEHIMHREPIEIGQEACDIINTARANGGKVVAVGTTSLRILESVAALQFPPPIGGRLGGGQPQSVYADSAPLPTSPRWGEELSMLQPYSGDTGIFITPGYRFKIVDKLMTNFHLPKSTLFMLVSAFAGLERMQQAYRHAIDREYRFYSYGDTSLLERANLPTM